MSTKIDSAGVYRGPIKEATLGTTKKGYPQYIVRLHANEKYVEDQAELEHFVNENVIEEATPQWVNWADFDEDIVAFLVLFNDAESFDENSILMNAEQLELAVGWDATEFDSLNDGSNVGKEIQFRVEEDDYNGQVKLKVNWIDAYDASPTRELKQMDKDDVKSLSSKLKMNKKKKPASASKPGKPSTSKPASKPASNAKPASSESSENEESFAESVEREEREYKEQQAKEQEQAESSETNSSESSTPPSRTTKTQSPDSGSAPSEGCSKLDAWQAACDAKGEHTDKEAEEAFIAGINDVSTERDDESFTPQEWAHVRDFAVNKLKS